ncbi:MAG: DUF1566 domain-containing protein [Candidatus Kapaibacterium sp.]
MKSLPFLFVVLVMTAVAPRALHAQQIEKTILKWPDTGQTISYTNVKGEDSDYQINVPAWRVRSAQTAEDKVTGLIWQRTDGGEMTFDAARKYADTLTLDGEKGWRLPTLLEALSIVSMDRNNPALDTSVFTNTKAEYWWTSQEQPSNTTRVWVTNSGGGMGPHVKTETISAGGTKKYQARVVKTGMQSVMVEHYTDNGDSTVTDNVTGLMWQRYPARDSVPWETALTRAEDARIAGHDDWRLPNLKDLGSLVDITRNAPAAPLLFTMQSLRYWTSTAQFKQTANAWFVDFQNSGLTSYAAKVRSYPVILVRSTSTATSIPDVSDPAPDVSAIAITPQPASDLVSLHMPRTVHVHAIRVYSSCGLLMHESDHPPTATYLLAVSSWPAGVYAVEFLTDNDVITSRFVVVR